MVFLSSPSPTLSFIQFQPSFSLSKCLIIAVIGFARANISRANFALDILALMNPITAIIRHFDKLKEGWNWIKDKVGLGDDKNTTTPKTTTTKPVGSHRTGESFVKNDGMYKLHYGERVLTKAENSQYSQGGVSSSPSINISINAVQELGNEIKRAIQPIVETTIKNYQTKQLMKMGIGGQ